MPARLLDSTAPIAVVGAGRLGLTLTAALLDAGYGVVAIGSRDRRAASQDLNELAGRVQILPASVAAGLADVVFLTVPDAVVGPVAEAIPWREGCAVVHCSGAQGLDVLAPAARVGALTGCFHPIQTFPSRRPEPERFRGITVGIEAQPPLDAFLEHLAYSLGAAAVRLEGVDRARYHAAAVFASNDVIALMAAAAQTWESAGLPAGSARTALAPLMLAAARNIAASPLEEALTGPLARGDITTIARHLDALAATPELAALYRLLARQLLTLPLSHSPEVAAQLRDLIG